MIDQVLRLKSIDEAVSLLLSEGIANYHYTLPNDKKEIMMDFYLLTSVYGMLKTEDEKLAMVFDDTLKEMLSAVRKELLSAVFYSICAEFRHIWKRTSVSLTEKWMKKNMPRKFAQVFSKIKGSMHVHRHAEYNEAYKLTKEAMAASGMDEEDFVRMAKSAFEKLEWVAGWGDEAWAAICDGWLRLYKASNTSDLIVAIDHVYDLQHNSDTVFNKVDAYAKETDDPDEDEYSWIQDALDYKAAIIDPWELWDKASAGLRPLMARVLKATFGTSADSVKDRMAAASKKLGLSVGDIVMCSKDLIFVIKSLSPLIGMDKYADTAKLTPTSLEAVKKAPEWALLASKKLKTNYKPKVGDIVYSIYTGNTAYPMLVTEVNSTGVFGVDEEMYDEFLNDAEGGDEKKALNAMLKEWAEHMEFEDVAPPLDPFVPEWISDLKKLIQKYKR